jgi:hypothetical protein
MVCCNRIRSSCTTILLLFLLRPSSFGSAPFSPPRKRQTGVRAANMLICGTAVFCCMLLLLLLCVPLSCLLVPAPSPLPLPGSLGLFLSPLSSCSQAAKRTFTLHHTSVADDCSSTSLAPLHCFPSLNGSALRPLNPTSVDHSGG